MKPTKITADLAQEVEADQIIALHSRIYGPINNLATRADFVWRYDRNPAGRAIIPVIRDDYDNIIGFIWVDPLLIRVRGENHLAATGTHLVIDPKYQNTFGYTKLIRRFQQVLRNHQIPLHYSFVNEGNYQHLRARGSQTASTIPFLIKPLNLKALIEDYFAGKWQRLIIRQAGRLVAPFFFRKPVLHCADGIVVCATENFDAGFDEFWRQTRNKYPAMAIRDRAFLSWRFAPVSGRNYHILTAHRRDRMLGYIVIRCATVRGVKTGLILDLLLLDHPRQMEVGVCLMAQAEAFFRTRKMSLAAGLMLPNASEYQVFLKAGYRCLPPAISPRPFRVAFFINNTSRESLKSLSIEDWFITFADYETR